MSKNAVYRVSFTWNKPADIVEAEFTDKHISLSAELPILLPKCKFIFQLERGTTNQLLHYQGHLKLAIKHRIVELAKKLQPVFPGIHLSPDSNVGSTNAEFYCLKKDPTYVSGPWADSEHIFEDFSDLREPSGWTLQVKNILLGPIEERKIYWIWESQGCTGKSNFATYMEKYHKIIGLGLGTANDNFYAVSELPARGYIFDVPRTLPQRFDWGEVYMSLEKIKDRNFLSTKYKPKKVLLPVIPHLIVFANVPPKREALSLDRWAIFKVVDNTLVPDN